MRIAFIGAVEFSRHCLSEILRNHGDVAGVFTLDPAKAGRHSDFADLTPLAKQHALAIHYVNNINDPSAIEAMHAAKPDVIFVFGWSQLIGEAIRSVAPCIGTHPALLPRNRGRHPIIWSLIYGLKESGLTFFHLDAGADSGDILWQQPFTITDDDDAGTLLKKIEQLAGEAIGEFLPQLAAGTAPRIPQDHSLANYWRKRTKDDGEIHWEQPAREIHNLIRALTRPYPGAHTHLEAEPVLVWKSRLTSQRASAEPGTILKCDDSGCFVATGDGTLELLEWQGNLRAGARFASLLTSRPTL